MPVCPGGRARRASPGCIGAVPLCSAGHTCGAPARCILTKPLPASCRASNLALCLQLAYLHALIDRHHPFNKLIQSLPAYQTQYLFQPDSLLLGKECSQELCHAVYFQLQCVESKLYPHIPTFPRSGVPLQWRGTVEVEDAAMALVQKSSSSSAVVSALDGGQTVQRMVLNLWGAHDQELFSQGVHVFLAQLENSLWSMKKDNPFNCLLMIANVSSLSKIFD